MARTSTYDEAKIFNYLVAHKAAHDGLLPSGVELCRHFGINSTQSLKNILTRLERRGWISGHALSVLHVTGGRWTLTTGIELPIQPAAEPKRRAAKRGTK